MAYFKYYPKIVYDIRGAENQRQEDYVTNIIARVLVKCHGWKDIDGSSHEALIATCEFEKYLVRDGDRPDTLANKFYGDSELHWIILYANGVSMMNPYYDWPLGYYDLNKFVNKKYGLANRNAVHHYEDNENYQVDSTAPYAEAVTNFKYEEAKNDLKRPIRIMQFQYVSLVVNEFKRLMAVQ